MDEVKLTRVLRLEDPITGRVYYPQSMSEYKRIKAQLEARNGETRRPPN